MLLRTACEFSDELESIASSLNRNVSLEELTLLCEINPDIAEDIDVVQEFFARNLGEKLEISVPKTETDIEEYPWLRFNPNCVWKRYFDQNWMVSEKGDVYDIETDTLKKRYFIDGEIRIFEVDGVATTAKRLAPIVAKCFGITSGNRNSRYIIEFIDGDRRNVSVTNIRWIPEPKDRPTDMQNIVDDICQRLVQFNGDVDKCLEMYEGSRPTITKSFIHDIRCKKQYATASDAYFTFQNGSFFVRPHVKRLTETDEGALDIGGLYLKTTSLELVIPLIVDKIKNDKNLTADEITILVHEYLLKNKKASAKDVIKYLKSEYNIEYPLDYISTIIASDSIIVKTMKGEE